jgi:hypothetical protein
MPGRSLQTIRDDSDSQHVQPKPLFESSKPSFSKSLQTEKVDGELFFPVIHHSSPPVTPQWHIEDADNRYMNEDEHYMIPYGEDYMIPYGEEGYMIHHPMDGSVPLEWNNNAELPDHMVEFEQTPTDEGPVQFPFFDKTSTSEQTSEPTIDKRKITTGDTVDYDIGPQLHAVEHVPHELGTHTTPLESQTTPIESHTTDTTIDPRTHTTTKLKHTDIPLSKHRVQPRLLEYTAEKLPNRSQPHSRENVQHSLPQSVKNRTHREFKTVSTFDFPNPKLFDTPVKSSKKIDVEITRSREPIR